MRAESGRFGDEADVVRAAMRLLDEQERRRWLTQALTDGEQAEENAGSGKPIKDAVKP